MCCGTWDDRALTRRPPSAAPVWSTVTTSTRGRSAGGSRWSRRFRTRSGSYSLAYSAPNRQTRPTRSMTGWVGSICGHCYPVEVCGGAAQKQDGEGVCQTQHPEALWLCSADLTENRSHLERHCWKRHWRCIVKLMEKPVSFGRHCLCVLRTPRKTDLI